MPLDLVLSKTGPLATPLPSACEVQVFDVDGTRRYWLMGDYDFRFILESKARIQVWSEGSRTRVSATYVMPMAVVLKHRLIQVVSIAYGIAVVLLWLELVQTGWNANSDLRKGVVFSTICFLPLLGYSLVHLQLSPYPSAAYHWLERTLALRRV